MAVYQFCNIYVLDAGNFNRGKAGYAADAAAGGAEEVAEDPVVASVSVDVAAGNDGDGFGVFVGFDDDGGAEDVDVLNEAECVSALELAEAGEDDACAEGVADEGDGANAEVAIDEGVGEDEAGCVGAVEGDGPGVVEEVGEFSEDYWELEGCHECDEDGGAEDLLE